MASYNKVLLMGNLTRDVELKYLTSGMQVASFGLAVNRKFKTASGEEREDILFVDCTAFGRTAEVINQYFSKGKPIFVDGRLKLDSWEDKNGGGKRSKLSVVVEQFQFVGGNRPAGDGEQQDGGGEYDQRPPSRSTRPPAQRPAARPPAEQPFADDGPQIDEESIPF